MLKKLILIVSFMSNTSVYGLTGSYTLYHGRTVLSVDVLAVGRGIATEFSTCVIYPVTHSEIATRLAKITVGEGVFEMWHIRDPELKTLALSCKFEPSTLAWIRAVQQVRPTPLGYAAIAGAALAGVGIYTGVKHYLSPSSVSKKDQHVALTVRPMAQA